MPSKSRGGRKRSARSKKRRTRQDFSLAGAQQQATAENHKPVSQAPSPSAKAIPVEPVIEIAAAAKSNKTIVFIVISTRINPYLNHDKNLKKKLNFI